MDVDSTLLGPRSSFTPTSFRSLAGSPHPVSFSSALVIVYNLRELDGSLAYSDLPAWKQLIDSTLATHKRISLIVAIFSDRNEVGIVGHLCGDDAQAFIDTIDEVSSHSFSPGTNGSVRPPPKFLYPVDQVLHNLPPRVRRRCLRTLYRICGRQALLPKSLTIPLCYDPTESPLCYGGFADVWKGQRHGRDVAAKVLRVYLKDGFEKIRRVGRLCTPDLL